MRVIAGKAGSIPLKTQEGLDTRPTTDRIKETLFNMLQTDIPGCKFLDLFSGSGAIGIEALSRGAEKAYFVENQKDAIGCIKENLAFTKLQDDGVIMECDVLTAINRLYGKELFDIIYMDPPYQSEAAKSVLHALQSSNILDEFTVIIIEAPLNADFSEADQMGYRLIKEKKYKTNKHIFLKQE